MSRAVRPRPARLRPETEPFDGLRRIRDVAAEANPRIKSRRKTSMRRMAAIFGAGLMLAAACTPAPPASTSPSPSAGQTDKPVAGGRLVLGAVGDPKTMEPVIATDTVSGAVLDKIYLPLVERDAKTGAISARLAEKFEQSADGLTITFTLR